MEEFSMILEKGESANIDFHLGNERSIERHSVNVHLWHKDKSKMFGIKEGENISIAISINGQEYHVVAVDQVNGIKTVKENGEIVDKEHYGIK